MAKQTNKSIDLHIENFPADVKVDAKVHATKQGLTLREYVIQAIQRDLKSQTRRVA